MNTPIGQEARRVHQYAGLAVIALGALGLLGWVPHIDLLREFGRDLPAMKINAALAFIFGGCALVFDGRHRFLAILCATLTALIGAPIAP